MKNGCNEVLEAKVAERSERAKKLYRYISDVSRRVGELTIASRSIVDLFSTNIEVQRQKLRDNCEKLIFLDPLNYGKKSLELLWRKVYYETVSTAKKLRESDSDNDSYLFTHIVCGLGHFHHLISRIQTEMKMQFKDLDYTPIHTDEENPKPNETPPDEEIQLSKAILHSCLIYLGDLSRYQAEIFRSFDPSIAARYYLQAAHMDMSLGMPYNQLGNLYLDKNYNLDSICYYIQCLNCVTPFEGATDNLTKLFEKNTQFYDAINDSETMSQTEHIQNTIVNFLSLIEIWYMSKNDTNIPQRCNTIAHELKISMDFVRAPLPDINKNYSEYTQAIEDENTNPSYLNTNVIHKIVQICLFTISKLTETDESKAFACKAFTLALLSQLLQKLLKQLESFGFKNPARKYKPRTTLQIQEKEIEMNNDVNEICNEEVIENDKQHLTNGHNDDDHVIICEEKTENDTEKIPNGETNNNTKKSIAKRRRRRRVASSESSDDMSGVDSESSEADSDESFSDTENVSNSSYHSEDSQSENSFDGSDIEDMQEKVNGNIEEVNHNKIVKENKDANESVENKNMFDTHENKATTDSQDKDDKLNVKQLQEFLLGDNFLSSTKLLQDWILTEKDLILSCGDSGESLFQCVVDLLNIFMFYFITTSDNAPNEKYEILEYAKQIAKKMKFECKTIPLPEDVNLRGTNICRFDKDAAEWQILERYNLSMYEENVIRILNFIDFGNQIAKIVPRIRFNKTMKIFYLKKLPVPKVNTKIIHKKSKEWHNSKKAHVESEGGLLRRLGRLWLASQVRELERSGQAATPALLALDTAVLYKHLRRVKQLLITKNFVLLVPTIVLQELDNLKREQSAARDAIRWLEVQLKSGSRFVRAQRPGQSRPLPLLKYPRKAPPHIHSSIQILEFCNHFVADEKQNQGGSGDSENSQVKSAPILILLVGNEPNTDEEPYKEFSVTGAAHAAGISVEYIGDFYAKWRSTIHKSGKKR